MWITRKQGIIFSKTFNKVELLASLPSRDDDQERKYRIKAHSDEDLQQAVQEIYKIL